MRVLFVGPSLHGEAGALRARVPNIAIRGPAGRGDILAALGEGAEAIGLVDGVFGDTPSVWHKEILHALECGVPVGGGASMGALRAAECATLGMTGIGAIFAEYASGELIDDEAVALAHAPAAFEWRPLSVPSVNFEATVRRAAGAGRIGPGEAELLLLAGRHLHYTERTFKAAVALCTDIVSSRRAAILESLAELAVDRKRQDAWEVAHWLAEVRTPAAAPPWTLSRTSHWLDLAGSVDRARGSLPEPAVPEPAVAMRVSNHV